MSSLKSKIADSPLLTGLVSPAVAARRHWAQRKLSPKVEVYDRLCQLLVSDPVIRVAEFDGDFFIDKRSTLFRRLLTYGYYEPTLVERCVQHIDVQKDIIDIGANIGFYSVLFAKKVAAGQRVLAVEPTKNAFERLTKNLELNEVTSQVITYNGVASNAMGEFEINTIPGKEEYSSLGVMEHPSIVQEEYISYKVPSSTLDALVDEHKLNPGFVKIDVEGAEHLVLQGADTLLSKHRPVILSEITNDLLKKNGASAQIIVDLIRSYNYKIVNPMFPGEPLESRPYGDILCLPQ
ncbi:FkbM family methyltransferase [filamentous cyanobacterium LEGE 11480]|uniref:FkbM family methyltransferase n=1 Tax=Romeriopsis navalis LEGE 11480 TaxID=2777977 RepID=A0A928Z2D0_9CYAN|nr:FkbM family methyltransferase [Romeriopsis navalis]MBE9028907.1 FkbM family methyltransferase [Romeriopsis navalis LEGE 11480]